MKNHTTAALRVEPFHILKTNEYCTPILEIAPLKPYNRTLSEEMQLIRRLHRHLPFQGKVKTGLRPFFPVWEGEVSGAWEMRGVPFVRSSSHPFPLYPLVSYSFPLSLYQGIT